jgi:cell division septation protein DedD
MRNFFFYSVALLPLVLLLACTSSEESTQNRGSQQTLPNSPARRGTNFTTNQDTLSAAVTKQSKTVGHSSSSPDSAGPKAYTVQIGAFTDPQYAVRAQRIAREWFTAYPVFNQFEASLKLYRVSIGKFEGREDAIALLKEMMKLHPKEYAECWVNTIPR